MTLIAALKGKNGFLVVADGRSSKEDGSIATDEERKIYEFSSYCVCMLTGGFIEDTQNFMAKVINDVIKDLGGNPHVDNYLNPPSEINGMPITLDIIAHAVRNHLGTLQWHKEAGWLRITENPAEVVFAGYIPLNGGYAPIMAYASARDGWGSVKPIKDDCLSLGEGAAKAKEIFDDEYSSTKSLRKLNKVAMKAMRRAHSTESTAKDGTVFYPVGGQTQLWHLRPGKPIRKLSPEKIEKLSR